MLEEASQLANSRGERLWLVGGFVRDLLLGRQSRDLDLVVEGDGIELATWLAKRRHLACRIHQTFLTAEVELGSESTVNIGTARRERYPRTAALPIVEPGSLDEDLRRRDFTINAIALEVVPGGFGQWQDPCEGRRDVESRKLRIIHSRSFVDDPTRAFRALRFEHRLGFTLEPSSCEALAFALSSGAFDALSGARLRAEVELFFTHLDNPAAAWRRAGVLGLFAVIDSELRWSEQLDRRLGALCRSKPEILGKLCDARILGRMMLLFDLEPRAMRRALARLDVQGRPAQRIEEAPDRVHGAAAKLRQAEAPHQVARILLELAAEELVLLWSEHEEARRWLSWADQELEGRRRVLSGQDLNAAGARPGPRLGAALEAVQDARWDGRIVAEGELAFALEFLASEPAMEKSSHEP